MISLLITLHTFALNEAYARCTSMICMPLKAKLKRDGMQGKLLMAIEENVELGATESFLRWSTSRTWFNLRKSIHHNMTEHTSLHEGNALKEDSYIFRSAFIPFPITLPSLFPLLRHAPVPKLGTKHLVTDALVLPCHLLLVPVTIGCDPQLAQLNGTDPCLTR